VKHTGLKGGSGTTPLHDLRQGLSEPVIDFRHLGYRWPTDTSDKRIAELAKNTFDGSVMDIDAVPFYGTGCELRCLEQRGNVSMMPRRTAPSDKPLLVHPRSDFSQCVS
jgi:hypothetical protein